MYDWKKNDQFELNPYSS